MLGGFVVKCPNCKTENSDRNYYCKWCKTELKEKVVSSNKKYYERHNYLFDLDIVEDSTNDRDSFISYRAKKKN